MNATDVDTHCFGLHAELRIDVEHGLFVATLISGVILIRGVYIGRAIHIHRLRGIRRRCVVSDFIEQLAPLIGITERQVDLRLVRLGFFFRLGFRFLIRHRRRLATEIKVLWHAGVVVKTQFFGPGLIGRLVCPLEYFGSINIGRCGVLKYFTGFDFVRRFG